MQSNKIKLTCNDCNKDFHGSCLKMSKADMECISADGLVWRCPPCASERRKSMRFETQMTEGKLTLEDIMRKVEEIFQSQKTLETNINISSESVMAKINDNTTAVKEQTEKVDRCLTKIEELIQENKTLKERINSLEFRLEEMEQYSRMNSVEIHGIPQEKNEDVVNIVKDVGKSLNMEISSSMIDACHRMGRRTGPNSSPPGIIVKFVRRLDKDELLQKRRVKSNLSTRHMNLRVDQPVYINEALTPARRKLLAAARQVKREKNIKFLWVRGGKIFLRKEEAAPVIHVSCQADLNKV